MSFFHEQPFTNNDSNKKLNSGLSHLLNKGTNSAFNNSMMNNKNVFGTNASSGNLFGTSSQNTAGSGLFGNTNAQTSITNTGNSFFGNVGSNTANTTMSNKNLFGNIGNTSTLNVNKSLYDTTSNQSNMSKNIFGAQNLNAPSQSNMGSIFRSAANESNITTQNLFAGSNTNVQGGAMQANKGIFSTIQNTNQSTSSGNLFGTLSSSTNQNKSNPALFSSLTPTSNTTTMNNSVFGNTLGTSQAKSATGLFGSVSQGGTSNMSSLFGSTLGTTTQNKPSTAIFANSTTSVGNTTNTLFSNQLGGTPSNVSSNMFTGLPTSNQSSSGAGLFGNTSLGQDKIATNMFANTGSSATTNTASGNIFGNVIGRSQLNQTTNIFGNTQQQQQQQQQGSTQGSGATIFGSTQPKPSSGLFGTTQTTSNTSNTLFGNTLGNTQTKAGGGFFGSLPQTTGTTTTSSMFGNNVVGTTQTTNPSGSVFATLQTSNTNTSGNIFGSTQAKPSTNYFGSLGQTNQTPAATNIFGSTTTQNQSTSNVFGTITSPTQNSSTGSGLFAGGGATSSQDTMRGTSVFGSLGNASSTVGVSTTGVNTVSGGIGSGFSTGLGTGGYTGGFASSAGTAAGTGTSGFGFTGTTGGFGTTGTATGTGSTGATGFGGATFGTTGTSGVNSFTSGFIPKTSTTVGGTTTTATTSGTSSGFGAYGTSAKTGTATFGGTSLTTEFGGTTGTTSTSGLPKFGTPLKQSGFGISGTTTTATGTNATGGSELSSFGTSLGNRVFGISGTTSSGTTTGASGMPTFGTPITNTTFGTTTTSTATAGTTGTTTTTIPPGPTSTVNTSTTGVSGLPTFATPINPMGFGTTATTPTLPTTTPTSTTTAAATMTTTTPTTTPISLQTPGISTSGLGISGGISGAETTGSTATNVVPSVSPVGDLGKTTAGTLITSEAAGGMTLDVVKTIFHGDKDTTIISSANVPTANVDFALKPTIYSDTEAAPEEVGSNIDATSSLDLDLQIVTRKKNVYEKIYRSDPLNYCGEEDTRFTHLDMIISDNINFMQRASFDALNDYDHLIWDNFKNQIFKTYTDYLINVEQKKNRNFLISTTAELNEYEFQILVWLYNVKSHHVDFIPFKSLYYLLLINSKINFSKMLTDKVSDTSFCNSLLEMNDHYFMNSLRNFLIFRNKGEIRIDPAQGIFRNLDLNSIYVQSLKDVLTCLLNTTLCITKEISQEKEMELKEVHLQELVDYSSYKYENMMLNYLFGTLQHLHDRFYKLEVSTYISKGVRRQIDEDYFTDSKSNTIFSYCFANFHDHKMDEHYSTAHFFFYLINIMFRCGNYVGLIQIIKNDEFVKHFNLDQYLKDLVILLIRILLLIYKQKDILDIVDRLKVHSNCSDILEKKMNVPSLVNYFFSIEEFSIENVYTYDMLSIVFSEFFCVKEKAYTNREKKIQKKNIFDYETMDRFMGYLNGDASLGGIKIKKSVSKGKQGQETNAYKNETSKNQSEAQNNNNNNNRKESRKNHNEGKKNGTSTTSINGTGNTSSKRNNHLLKKMDERGVDGVVTYRDERLRQEIEKINKSTKTKRRNVKLEVTNPDHYNFEYSNLETTIWLELSAFVAKNFDVCGVRFIEGFDIINDEEELENISEELKPYVIETKQRRLKINEKIGNLFANISYLIINENKSRLEVCSKLDMDDILHNLFVKESTVVHRRKAANNSKVLQENIILYIKLFYYLLLVGNIYTSTLFLSCVSVNVQRVLLGIVLFLHQNNVFEYPLLKNLKNKTLNYLKFSEDDGPLFESPLNMDDLSVLDTSKVTYVGLNNIDIPFENLIVQNNNMDLLLKITYLLCLRSELSIDLLKRVVRENLDTLMDEMIMGQINNNGTICYGKLYDFIFLFKNKIEPYRDTSCEFLMYYMMQRQTYPPDIVLSNKRYENQDYYCKFRNFKFVHPKHVNTLSKMSVDKSLMSIHYSIVYKISQFYTILAYFANQAKNYVKSFICYYILKNEESAMTALMRIYNDEYIYYYHNEDEEYKYIRKCAFRFYYLAKNMWPANVKLCIIEKKAQLIWIILFMKKKMFEEAFAIFISTNLVSDILSNPSLCGTYFTVDMVSCYLITNMEMSKKRKYTQYIRKPILNILIDLLLPIKDKLHGEVAESMDYLKDIRV